MKYNPSTYIVKAFSPRQSLWAEIGTDSTISLSHRFPNSLNIKSRFPKTSCAPLPGSFFVTYKDSLL